MGRFEGYLFVKVIINKYEMSSGIIVEFIGGSFL